MFDQLRRAVGHLEAVSRALDPGCLDGRAAAALVEVAARGERLCSAIKALGSRRVEETNAWRWGGHRSAAHWVAEATGETVGAAGRALETARALEHLPETDARSAPGGSLLRRPPRSRAPRVPIPPPSPRCWRRQSERV